MFERIGIFTAAYADYVRAVDRDPSDMTALSGLATTAIPAGQQSDALDRLRRLDSLHPSSTPILIALSKLMHATGRDEAAVKAALAAVTAGGDRLASLDALAALLADMGDATRLAAVTDELDRLQPKSAKSLYYRASQYFVEGRFEGSLSYAQQSITLAPQDADARNLAGAALASLHRPDEAHAMLLTALNLSPADASIYLNLGLLSLEQREGAKAQKYFAGALALDPSSEAAAEGFRQAASMQVR
jgi:Flp pilus assembly protein TadD